MRGGGIVVGRSKVLVAGYCLAMCRSCRRRVYDNEVSIPVDSRYIQLLRRSLDNVIFAYFVLCVTRISTCSS